MSLYPANCSISILTRHILGKLLISGLQKFMKKEAKEKLNEAFLKENPLEDPRDVSGYIFPFNIADDSTYGSQICDLDLKWIPVSTNEKDLDGNIWTTSQIRLKLSSGSTYGCSVENFVLRVECLTLLASFVSDITNIIKDPVRVMSYDNQKRISIEAEKRHNETSEKVKNIVSYHRLRNHLRIGSYKEWSPRMSPGNLFPVDQPGEYYFYIEDGCRRNKRTKKYIVKIPSNQHDFVVLRRIS